MTFAEKLSRAASDNNSLLATSLDPDIAKIPEHLRGVQEPFFEFNRAILDSVADLLCAVKLNSAMYEAAGVKGIEQLKKTCVHIQKTYPDLPIILDAKRGDVINTNEYYAKYAFEYLNVDALTIHSYLGKEANEPFLRHKDKGIFVLCRTSNPGAGEFQDLRIARRPLYEIVAEEVAGRWNDRGNCHLVVGATYPQELAEIREIVGQEMLILTPGLGAQGGDTKLSIKAGINKQGGGLVSVSARGIIFASNGADFAEAARKSAAKLREEINSYR